MGLKERFYPETTYGGFSYVDGTIAFFSRVNALLKPESVVVDFGCGRGAGGGFLVNGLGRPLLVVGGTPLPFRHSLLAL